jgi:hypothetical protein
MNAAMNALPTIEPNLSPNRTMHEDAGLIGQGVAACPVLSDSLHPHAYASAHTN